jgi:hypothetical protein
MANRYFVVIPRGGSAGSFPATIATPSKPNHDQQALNTTIRFCRNLLGVGAVSALFTGLGFWHPGLDPGGERLPNELFKRNGRDYMNGASAQRREET